MFQAPPILQSPQDKIASPRSFPAVTATQIGVCLWFCFSPSHWEEVCVTAESAGSKSLTDQGSLLGQALASLGLRWNMGAEVASSTQQAVEGGGQGDYPWEALKLVHYIDKAWHIGKSQWISIIGRSICLSLRKVMFPWLFHCVYLSSFTY